MWLQNDEFLVVYTPTAASYESAPESTFQLVTRQTGTSNYAFQKLLDPSPPFGINRFPPSHFINRLLDFSPDLTDLLIVASTCSPDIGLLTKSKKPLSSDMPAETITNKYTTTALALDNRRAQLPCSEDTSDTSPIGVAIDLSSRDNVNRPIPGDEMEESITPLPALMVLNHEGLLSAWWVVYNDAVRQGTAYPGLIAAGSRQQASAPATTSPVVSNTQSAFGASLSKPTASTFGQSSTLGMGVNKQSPWGTSTNTTSTQMGSSSAFGKPAFGQAAFGQPSQPQSAFGQPSQPKSAFGSPSALGASSANAAFGSATSLGNRLSPWATSNSSGDAGSKPANPFGGANAATSSPFSKLGDNNSTASPFSNTSSSSPFASMAQKQGSLSSGFRTSNNNLNKPPGITPEPSFGSTVDLGSTNSGSSFGQPSTLGSGISTWGTPSTSSSAFAAQQVPQAQNQTQEMEMGDDSISTQKPATPSNNVFGLGSGGFKLSSAFKGDGTAKDDLPKPKDLDAGLFSMGLGESQTDTQKPLATPIKKEPEEPKLSEISTTPASPPKAVQSPKTEAPFHEKEKPAEPTDAPLPPDPTSAKFRAKQLELNANMPPGVGNSKSKPALSEVQLPKAEELPPLAGSPPIDLGEGSSPLSDIPDESLDQMKAKSDQAPKSSTPVPKPAFSFTPESKPSQETEVSGSQKLQQFSTTPLGFPRPAAANFSPPTTRPIASPRSPSPTRNFTTPAAPSGKPLVPSLSGSRPPSRPISQNERPLSRSNVLGTSSLARQDSGSRTPQSHTQSQVQRATIKAPEPAPEVSDLQDDEDERIRKLLESEVEPTKTLDPFVAHQDYAGLESKTGLLGQMERTYRDINSMLDTLGLNARAMQGWIEGQHTLVKEGGRDFDDLDKDEEFDDWCLVEANDLIEIQNALSEQLDEGRVTDVPGKIQDLAHLQREMHRVRARIKDLRKALDVHLDPEKIANQRAQPLSSEQSQQQAELRRSFAQFQVALNDAEEGISLLRAKLASLSSKEGERKGAPTVAAVRRTIEKMTAMVERKHNDVTILEAQMRKLNKGLMALSLEDDSPQAINHRGAGDGSPFQTPPSSRGKFAASVPPSADSSAMFRTLELRRSMMPGTYALEYSPSAGSASVHSSPVVRRILGASVGSNGSVATPRKKMGGVSEEDVQRFNEKTEARKRVLGSLRQAVERKGVRETKLDN